METHIDVLSWRDLLTPHRLWVEEQEDQSTRLCMKIVKEDGTEEMLYLVLEESLSCVLSAWQGRAFPVTEAYERGCIYSQVRSLLNLPQGCVLWSLTRVLLPDGRTISVDKLGFVPGMRQCRGRLVSVERASVSSEVVK